MSENPAGTSRWGSRFADECENRPLLSNSAQWSSNTQEKKQRAKHISQWTATLTHATVRCLWFTVCGTQQRNVVKKQCFMFLLFIPLSTLTWKQENTVILICRCLQKRQKWINLFSCFRLNEIIEWIDGLWTYEAHWKQKEALYAVFWGFFF